MSNLNTRVLQEPLGFIRVIELPLAILAFATTAGYSATTIVTATCDGKPKQEAVSWGYPFGLNSVTMPNDICTPTNELNHPFPTGAVSQAQFFVFVGVISFLYVLAILAVYLLLWPKYEDDGRFALADFVVTAVFAVFWFISSCAWASGVNIVKDVTDRDVILERLSQHDGPAPCNKAPITPTTTPSASTTAPTQLCTVDGHWNYASLNVSLITGFACFALWLANLWFIYKETPWYKARAAITTPQPGPGAGTSVGATASGGHAFR